MGRPTFTEENLDKLNEELNSELSTMAVAEQTPPPPADVPKEEKLTSMPCMPSEADIDTIPQPETVETPAPLPQATVTPPTTAGKTTDKAKAEACSFKVDANKFFEYLEGISLNRLILDAFIEVKPTHLFCAFAEPTCQYISGFNEFHHVVVTQTGKMVITDIGKIKDTVKLYCGEITISYACGKITVKGAGKKALTITTLDESYINSLKGILNRKIDLENKIIGNVNFGEYSNFKIDTASLVEVLNAGNALKLEKHQFSLRLDSKDIEVVTTNNQDTCNITLSPTDLVVKKDFDVKFASRGLTKITSVFSGIINVWVGEHILVANSGTSYYLLISELK